MKNFIYAFLISFAGGCVTYILGGSFYVGAFIGALTGTFLPDYRQSRRYHQDCDLIDSIATRYDVIMGTRQVSGLAGAKLYAYLNAAHNGSHPMRLDELRNAPEPLFLRETLGFIHHYDPVTDTFKDGFVPAYLKGKS